MVIHSVSKYIPRAKTQYESANPQRSQLAHDWLFMRFIVTRFGNCTMAAPSIAVKPGLYLTICSIVAKGQGP